MNRPPRTHLDHDGYLGLFGIDARSGWSALHFTVKRGFRLQPGSVMTPCPRQQVCFIADRYFEDAPPHLASVRYESDLGPPKRLVDLIVDARCHPPGGEALRCDVTVRAGAHPPVTLAVIGDRLAFVAPDGSVRFSPARPFSSRPIRFEWAYGGVALGDQMAFPNPANPVGTGYMTRTSRASPSWRWAVMPSIEVADDLITPETFLADADPYRARRPAGFGWISRFWTPRVLDGGLPPEAAGFWSMLLADRGAFGGVARSRQARFHQGASPDLQLPLEGHEIIRLTHLHPVHPHLTVQLPMVRPLLRVQIDEGEFRPVPVTLATVHVEVERETATLAWRGTLQLGDGPSEQPRSITMKVDGRHLPDPRTVTDLPFDPSAPPVIERGDDEDAAERERAGLLRPGVAP